MRTAHAGLLSDTTHDPMVTSDANSACWTPGHNTLSEGTSDANSACWTSIGHNILSEGTSDANSACWIYIGHNTLSDGDVEVCLSVGAFREELHHDHVNILSPEERGGGGGGREDGGQDQRDQGEAATQGSERGPN